MNMVRLRERIPGIVFGLAAVFAFFALFAKGFASFYNLQNLLKDCSLLIIVSLGMNLAIVAGRINISVGAVMSLCGVTTGILFQTLGNMWAAILAGLLAGLIFGLLCGYLIAYQKFSDWVVTYAFMGIAQGLALAASNGSTVPGFTAAFRWIATGKLFGIYTMILIAAFFCVMFIWLSSRTKFGYDVYAIGGSEESAGLAGIHVKKRLLEIFIITDLLAAVSGILLAAKSNSASPIGGQGYEWDAIAAVLIGGTPFDGGRGRVGGCIIGSVLMRTLRNGLTMIGLSPYWQTFLIGAVVMLVIVLDGISEHRKKIQAARRVYK